MGENILNIGWLKEIKGIEFRYICKIYEYFFLLIVIIE